MFDNQYGKMGVSALQAGSPRFESAIAHKCGVNWKSVFYGFPIRSFLSSPMGKCRCNSGYMWVYVGTCGYILLQIGRKWQIHL